MNPLSINTDRVSLDESYMRMAEEWGDRSKANRKRVGALIVRDNQIISDGYNGMPHGADDDVCEYYDEDGNVRTKEEVLHAESNALMKISRLGGRGCEGATLYSTVGPCFHCAKLIVQAKIARVVYREEYRDLAGVALCRRYKIQVDQLE